MMSETICRHTPWKHQHEAYLYAHSSVKNMWSRVSPMSAPPPREGFFATALMGWRTRLPSVQEHYYSRCRPPIIKFTPSARRPYRHQHMVLMLPHVPYNTQVNTHAETDFSDDILQSKGDAHVHTGQKQRIWKNLA